MSGDIKKTNRPVSAKRFPFNWLPFWVYFFLFIFILKRTENLRHFFFLFFVIFFLIWLQSCASGMSEILNSRSRFRQWPKGERDLKETSLFTNPAQLITGSCPLTRWCRQLLKWIESEDPWRRCPALFIKGRCDRITPSFLKNTTPSTKNKSRQK